MRKQLLLVLVSSILAVAGATPAVAASKPAAKSSGAAGAMYRYKNDKGVMVIESSISPEYAAKGYQVLNRSGQVIEEVAPAMAADALQEERRKAEQGVAMSRKDAELRKLYSSPQDAERLRDRQIESIALKIDFTRGQLQQLNGKRRAEIEQAARLERKGTPVPASLRETIDRLGRQVALEDATLKGLEADRLRMQTEFAPIIERLKVIYPEKVAPAAPAAAVPAAPATAPVAPAAPPRR